MIAIIDYDAGNLTSVARAVTHIGVKCIISNNIKEITTAERIIFPGVGAAGSAMESLKRLGLDRVIKEAFTSGKPILGICLGTQIIMGYSEEDNHTECLGIIRGSVRAFSKEMKSEEKRNLKIPHMGWNRVSIRQEHPVFSGISETDEFYFVHSYYPAPDDPQNIIGETDYGISFASVIGCKNIVATQFHPEKSGEPGLRVLKNFCSWQPKVRSFK